MRRSVKWIFHTTIALVVMIAVLGAASVRHDRIPPTPIEIPRGVDLCGATPSELAALTGLSALRSRTDEAVLERTGMSTGRSHEILICESGPQTIVSVHYRDLPGALPPSGSAVFRYEHRRLIPQNAAARILLH